MLSRRRLVQGGVAAPLIYAGAKTTLAATLERDYDDDCGIAAGSPEPDGFVVWTRLPPVARDGARADIEVACEVATTLDFRASSVVMTVPLVTGEHCDYTAKSRVFGLASDTVYYYRFRNATGWISATGRARTLPARDATPASVRFAAVSCQRYSEGHYTAYSHLCREDVDYCVHLGDHIYEKEPGKVRGGDPLAGREAKTLDDYRRKHRYYLSDAAYREARRKFTWIDLWDDHEVYNDYAGSTAADAARLSAAYQAYLEYMPIIPQELWTSRGVAERRLYRSFVFGDLLAMHLVDQRQYRDGEVCSRSLLTTRCSRAEAPARTMLGRGQREWLDGALGSAPTRWQVLLSEVVMAPLRAELLEASSEVLADAMLGPERAEIGGVYLSLDAWDGYPAEREAIYDMVERHDVANFVVVTGDVHAAFNARLLRAGARPDARPVGYEIVTTSISSKTLGDYAAPYLGRPRVQRIITDSNPHLEWSDVNAHGYTVVTVAPDGLSARHVAVETVEAPTSGARVAREWRLPAR